MATSNIPCPNQIIIRNYTSASFTLTQYGLQKVTFSIAVDGYYPIGVGELFFADTAVFTVASYAFNSARTSLSVDIVNNWSGSRSSSLTVTVMYKKI